MPQVEYHHVFPSDADKGVVETFRELGLARWEFVGTVDVGTGGARAQVLVFMREIITDDLGDFVKDLFQKPVEKD